MALRKKVAGYDNEVARRRYEDEARLQADLDDALASPRAAIRMSKAAWRDAIARGPSRDAAELVRLRGVRDALRAQRDATPKSMRVKRRELNKTIARVEQEITETEYSQGKHASPKG